jgi:hypothetical protein
MRKTFTTVFILLGVTSAFGQVDIKGLSAPMSAAPHQYTTSFSAIDQFGHLLVFDTVYSYAVPVPGQPAIPSPPKTRITVVPASGQDAPLTREYPAITFQILGVGQQALYSLAYSYTIANGKLTSTRTLVAIDVGPAGVLLPADFSGFPAASLLPTGDAKLSGGADNHSSDTISSVEPPANPLSTTPVQRRARVIRFDGIRFSSKDAPLP